MGKQSRVIRGKTKLERARSRFPKKLQDKSFYYSGVTQGMGEDRLILHFNTIEHLCCHTALEK